MIYCYIVGYVQKPTNNILKYYFCQTCQIDLAVGLCQCLLTYLTLYSKYYYNLPVVTSNTDADFLRITNYIHVGRPTQT